MKTLDQKNQTPVPGSIEALVKIFTDLSSQSKSQQTQALFHLYDRHAGIKGTFIHPDFDSTLPIEIKTELQQKNHGDLFKYFANYLFNFLHQQIAKPSPVPSALFQTVGELFISLFYYLTRYSETFNHQCIAGATYYLKACQNAKVLFFSQQLSNDDVSKIYFIMKMYLPLFPYFIAETADVNKSNYATLINFLVRIIDEFILLPVVPNNLNHSKLDTVKHALLCIERLPQPMMTFSPLIVLRKKLIKEWLNLNFIQIHYDSLVISFLILSWHADYNLLNKVELARLLNYIEKLTDPSSLAPSTIADIELTRFNKFAEKASTVKGCQSFALRFRQIFSLEKQTITSEKKLLLGVMSSTDQQHIDDKTAIAAALAPSSSTVSKLTKKKNKKKKKNNHQETSSVSSVESKLNPSQAVEIVHLRQQLEKVTAENQELKRNLDEQKQEAVKTQVEKVKLNKKINEKNQQLQEKSKQLDKLKEENKQLLECNEGAKEKAENIIQNLKNSNEKNKKLTKDNNSLSQTNSKLEEKYNQLTKKNTKLTQQYTVLQLRFQQARENERKSNSILQLGQESQRKTIIQLTLALQTSQQEVIRLRLELNSQNKIMLETKTQEIQIPRILLKEAEAMFEAKVKEAEALYKRTESAVDESLRIIKRQDNTIKQLQGLVQLLLHGQTQLTQQQQLIWYYACLGNGGQFQPEPEPFSGASYYSSSASMRLATPGIFYQLVNADSPEEDVGFQSETDRVRVVSYLPQ